MSSITLGRLPASEAGKPVLHDAPEKQIEAMLSQQDAIIAAIKALCVKLDADTSLDEDDYAATISDPLAPLALFI